MLRAKNIWVVGGDRRQEELAALLRDDGHTVHTYALGRGCKIGCEENVDQAHRADCVVLPLPATGEGGLLTAPLSDAPHPPEEILDALCPGQLVCAGMPGPALEELCTRRGLILQDYFAREELALLNAIPTAEGAIQIAMEELPVTLHECRVLILGFGRIGQALAVRLRGLGSEVTVAARRHEARALARSMGCRAEALRGVTEWLCSFDLVVNTIPAPVLGVEELSALKEGALVIDLASRPGGVDMKSAAALGVKAVWALSLPGKVAPVTAGRYIMEAVYHIMEGSL